MKIVNDFNFETEMLDQNAKPKYTEVAANSTEKAKIHRAHYIHNSTIRNWRQV